MSSHAISLAGRRALVTGGGKGIGRAIAQSLAEAGATVIVSGRSAPALEEVAQATGGEAIVADVAAPDGVTSLVSACASRGRIDILVNNAGVAEGAPLGRTDDAMWERALTLNATAPFQLCRALLPAMIDAGWGRVINVASVAGLTGSAYTAAYCASKHALVGLTRALAAELAAAYGDGGVTVNALCPGWVHTEMADRAVARIAGTTGRSEAQARGALEGMSGQRRMMSAEEVAFAALTLCADHARGIHGQALVIDGGGLLR
jgi:3-hydroxybutyrate dehydrogenase